MQGTRVCREIWRYVNLVGVFPPLRRRCGGSCAAITTCVSGTLDTTWLKPHPLPPSVVGVRRGRLSSTEDMLNRNLTQDWPNYGWLVIGSLSLPPLLLSPSITLSLSPPVRQCNNGSDHIWRHVTCPSSNTITS